MENEQKKPEDEQAKPENGQIKAEGDQAEQEAEQPKAEAEQPKPENAQKKPEPAQAKPAKPVKIPGALKNPIKEKKFEKRFLKYIEHPQDKKFFAACFIKQEDKYVIRENLVKADVKKLKELLKWIKKNRAGPIKVVPLLFTAAVVAAVVIFFMVFANPLLKYATEKGLEAVFEAKADVTEFRLRLVPLEFRMGSITVANRDAPMTNLFEMGLTTIRLKTQAVLQGKIYIEEIRADKIQFGTPRTVSGAIPLKPPKPKKEKPPKEEGPPMIDLQNFDAMGLLNQEFSKLNTPKLYDQAIETYNTTLAKWQGEADATKAKITQLQDSAKPLMALNVGSIRDIETVQKTIQDINTMVSTVQTASDDVKRMIGGIESDINTARQLEQNARNALTDDINHLKSYVDLGSGNAFAVLEPYIRDILSDSAEKYMDYGLMALDTLQKLKDMNDARPKSEPKPKKEKKVAFKGRDVIFPVRSYPKFFLGILASDFTLETWNWAFDLRDVSSNPDLTNKPVSLTLGLKEETGLKRQVGFNGRADFRSSPQDKFSVDLNGTGFPISLGDELSQAGIGGFQGLTGFSINMKGFNNGGITTGGDVRISQAEILKPKGTIAEAVAEAVKEAGNVDLGIQYTYNPGGNDDFKITTNLVDLITAAIKRLASAYAQKAMDEIEKALRAKIDEYIDGRFVDKEQLDLLLRAARGDATALDGLKNNLTNKRNEFEQKIRGAVDDAAQQAKAEAERQAQQAAQDALKGQTPTIQAPSIQTPSIPGLPGRR